MLLSLGRGDVVLAAFPFSDLSDTKRRPSVIVAVDARLGDFTLAFITSQQATSADSDEVALLPSHLEFRGTGLAVPSKIRAGKLVTLAPRLLIRRLGRLGPRLTAALDEALLTALSIETTPYREAGQRLERERLATLHLASGAAAVLVELSLSPVP